jgi:transglutaminase-like putative cysteine protease
MKFAVSHTTRYLYDAPVILEPHTFRLFPRANGAQRVSAFQIEVDPPPSRLSESLDAENNGVHQVWFDDPVTRLVVRTSFEVETLRANPFDFILSDLSMATMPVVYPPEESATLAPYCTPQSRGAQNRNGAVYSFARAVAQGVEWHTLPFLTALNRKLHDFCEHTLREEGDPRDPEVTLASRSGACRDMAVVFIEACRSVGLAARFVSGYELTAARGERADMHAWAEIYLPGGGWRGYDPSRGLAAAERYIAVASGLTPRLAAPVSGSFRGTGVHARLEFEIVVDERG